MLSVWYLLLYQGHSLSVPKYSRHTGVPVLHSLSTLLLYLFVPGVACSTAFWLPFGCGTFPGSVTGEGGAVLGSGAAPSMLGATGALLPETAF